MKTIDENLVLGLDLGITSIGWALIKTKDSIPHEIVDMGVRIIPLNPDETDEFTKGNAITKNRDRTLKRTQRKGLDRYQLRRKALLHILADNDMMPDKKLLLYQSPIEIWGTRAKAATEKVSLQQLGRVLLHLNQKRGYLHSKTDQVEDSKQTEYVQKVNERYRELVEKKCTLGQYFYSELKNYFETETKEEIAFRIKEKVFPRAAYIEEFDSIWRIQKIYYPEILTPALHQKIRNEILYYQRKLKSQKGLVSICEFEGRKMLNKEGKEIFTGPKVAPRSSPLFQVCKLWESINTISVKNRRGEIFPNIHEYNTRLFDYLDTNEKLSQTELFKMLGLGRTAGYFTNTLISKKGIQGNTTRHKIAEIIGNEHPALRFNLVLSNYVDKSTGEVKPIISPDFETEPLYRLWHIIYSLEENDCIRKLQTEFGFDTETAQKLSAIDFTKPGFGNKSAKAIRKIMPYLQQDNVYSKACEMAGYNHSNSLTKEENSNRELVELLSALPKNSLRQPVVEKILNQLINLVNGLIEKHGKPFEIRVELARELKQSREERNNTYNAINKRDRENKAIEKKLQEHPEFLKKRVSRKDIDKYRLWEEFDGISPYEPTKRIGFGELFSGRYDIEHIIPRSIRFDDSFSNKTICKRELNSGENGKNNFTALDYMQQKRSKDDFDAYLMFIEKTYANKKISKTKYENLLRKATDLKEGFIERQLRETQYIARKSREILSQICHNVYSTSGTITQRLRDLWGWDEVLERLNFPKYQQLGLTEEIETMIGDKPHTFTKIKKEFWTKRNDHRHHAIDALAIACTSQGFIQRLNTLNAQHTRDEMYNDAKQDNPNYSGKKVVLDNYLLKYKPFNTSTIQKAIEKILISFKPGKKVATLNNRIVKKGGKKMIAQQGIISPRGALSEESVYGKIKRKTTKTVKLDKNFTQAENIIDPFVKRCVFERLTESNNDPEKAFKNLKSNPLWANEEKNIALTTVDIFEWVDEFVIRYPLSTITEKDVKFIVDEKIREIVKERLEAFNNNHKDAFKDLENNPVWLNEEKKIPIKNVRCYTNLSADTMATVRVHDASWGIEYEKYLKPGNNHHIAIYQDESGKLFEHVVTFWHAVERKKFALPVIIKQPEQCWDEILHHRELPQAFLEKLPNRAWRYVTSMQQNEYFVFNMELNDLQTAINQKQYETIAPNLFRVRKLTYGNFWFNHQYETQPRESLEDKKAGRCKQASLSTMKGIKVKVNNLGEIFLAE